ncbi:MAG TPA: carboxymuconolactone decarboxylase family protein [Polyangiaceae bacterium]|nr:carboxymuconolactone decarboxylase family protein [Polyangiaceae bacterium]
MTHRDFPRFDENTAPAGAREPLAQTRKAFGMLPAPLTRYASSPMMLGAALTGLDAFEKSSLEPLEREVLAMTMGRLNSCKFCLDFHRRALKRLQAPSELVGALELGEPLANARLEALRRFVLALLEERGDVSRRVWDDFRAAGYTHQQALEVLTGVSVYTLTTLANRLTETSE